MDKTRGSALSDVFPSLEIDFFYFTNPWILVYFLFLCLFTCCLTGRIVQFVSSVSVLSFVIFGAVAVVAAATAAVPGASAGAGAGAAVFSSVAALPFKTSNRSRKLRKGRKMI